MTNHLLYFNVNRGQESSMEKWWFNSMLLNDKLEYMCGLSNQCIVLILVKIPVEVKTGL